MDRVAIYLRKSRADLEAEVRGDGETLAKHRKALLSLAKEQGLNVVRIREEIASGESLIHRPEMMELLKEVERGEYDAVLCMDLDRLGRGNMQEQGLILETFRKSGTKIITPHKTYDLNNEIDEELSELQAFFARKELKIINRRLYQGRVRSVKEGNWVGSTAPYGYRIVKDEKGYTLEPHPDEAPVVRLIFELYTHPDPERRMGSWKIANKLNEMGLRNRFGDPWQANAVAHIIKRAPVYRGMIQWRKTEQRKLGGGRKKSRTRDRSEWIVVKGRHQPLIDEETFRRAQEYLSLRTHPPYYPGSIKNPLAGLVKCGKCGKSMIRNPYWNTIDYLVCFNQACNNKPSRLDRVEAVLLDTLEQWLDGYRLQWEPEEPKDDESELRVREKALEDLRRELTTLEGQKERLYDLLERGIYDEDTFMERSARLASRISDTRAAIEKAEKALEEERKRVKARREVIPRVEKVLEQYRTLKNPKHKNALLKTVLEKVVYIKEPDQEGFTLKVFPKLNKC